MEVLAQSANFQVLAEYETVFLRSGGRQVVIGDFISDPAAVHIDPQERWCVMVGCGLIVYYLREPFEAYEYSQSTRQWFEFAREADNIYWFETLEAGPDVDTVALTATGENAGNYFLRIPPDGGEPRLEVISRLYDEEEPGETGQPGGRQPIL